MVVYKDMWYEFNGCWSWEEPQREQRRILQSQSVGEERMKYRVKSTLPDLCFPHAKCRESFLHR